jgi:hypothetical protein
VEIGVGWIGLDIDDFLQVLQQVVDVDLDELLRYVLVVNLAVVESVHIGSKVPFKGPTRTTSGEHAN